MTIRIVRVINFVALVTGVFLFAPSIVSAQNSPPELTLSFVKDGYYENIAAGDRQMFLLEVRNNSLTTIADIALSATMPTDWTVTINPQQIKSLSAENFTTVNIEIAVPRSASPDTYQIPIRADTGDIHQSIVSTINVQRARGLWWIIGGIVTAVVIAGFIFVYFFFSRR